MNHILCIGAGQAAASLAARLRALGHEGPITIVGDEPVPPYQRPPLSKGYLLGEMSLERLFLKPESFYEQAGIRLITGTPARALDPASRRVTLESGEALDYDQLVLATGATPNRLPEAIGGALGGVFTVRTLADVDAMAPEIAPGRRALVVGGGYIGLEAAAVARKRGMEVVLIEAAPRILGRVACEETAAWFRAKHRAEGVDLREGTALARLLPDASGARVAGAELADGTRLEVDCVIVGIGVRPATALAEAAGLALDNGIAVDARGRTSAEGVWAAGDCASFPHEGGRLRLESVGNAIDMGELVAENLIGAERDYVARPWFWSDQYDAKLQIAGLGTGHDTIVTRGGGAHVSHWYYRGERLIAVDAINDPRAYMIGKRLIEAGKSPPKSLIADPEADLKALLT